MSTSKRPKKNQTGSDPENGAQKPRKKEQKLPETAEEDQDEDQGHQKRDTRSMKHEDESLALTSAFWWLRRWSFPIQLGLIAVICVISFAIRVFSVIKFESVIHEYDPWFNYRATKYLVTQGPYAFWNWYDSESWYPLGRVVGGTVFPGIMFTGAFFKKLFDFLAFPLDIRNVCVFMAPIFATFQSISMYLFTKECTNRPDAGLFSALFIAVIPAIIARGSAGSYDNEAVAIFALVNTFYLWIKACNTGSILWSVACTLSYFYMVASWGGYSFIINIIPVFVLGTMFINRFTLKIYVAYSVFYTLGTILAMLITFVNFQVMRSAEHLASHFTFVAINLFVLGTYIKNGLEEAQVRAIMRLASSFTVVGFILLFLFLTVSGTTKISGRVMVLIDPTHAKNNSPLVQSVAEHSPSTWASYFLHMHVLVIFAPVGFYYTLVHKITHGKLFLGMYGVFIAYFSCVMNRLQIVLAPAVCALSAIAVSQIIRKTTKSIRLAIIGKKQEKIEIQNKQTAEDQQSLKEGEAKTKSTKIKRRIPIDISILITCLVVYSLRSFIHHSTSIAHDSFSSTEFIFSEGDLEDGDRVIIDEHREGYRWLSQNTPPDSKILAWWDFGYQLAGMSNRTTLIDNNTWNNTHIATVGKFFLSNEEEGYEIAQSLGANYVLRVFGGQAKRRDELPGFLWYVRIAASVFKTIDEQEFYKNRDFGISKEKLSDKFANSIFYKTLYYRFGELPSRYGRGYDKMRKAVIGHKDFTLTHFKEVYTSKSWIIRIYEILPRSNRGPTFVAPPRKLWLQTDPQHSAESGLEHKGGETYRYFEPKL